MQFSEENEGLTSKYTSTDDKDLLRDRHVFLKQSLRYSIYSIPIDQPVQEDREKAKGDKKYAAGGENRPSYVGVGCGEVYRN